MGPVWLGISAVSPLDQDALHITPYDLERRSEGSNLQTSGKDLECTTVTSMKAPRSSSKTAPNTVTDGKTGDSSDSDNERLQYVARETDRHGRAQTGGHGGPLDLHPGTNAGFMDLPPAYGDI